MQYPSLQTYDIHAGDGQILEMQASGQGQLQELATRLDVIRFELLAVADGVAGHCGLTPLMAVRIIFTSVSRQAG
jgi:hypothetical protein